MADQGKWHDAAALYQEMLKDAPTDAALHYNRALCHEQAGEVGPAVLGYERALRLAPRAADARRNLTLLREKHALTEANTLAPGLPTFTAWFSREEWTCLSLAAALLMIAAAWWAVLRAAPKRRAFPLSLAILGCFLMTACAVIVRKRGAEDQLAVVTAADVALRLSPFATAEEITASPAGSLIRIQSAQGDFVYAELLPQGTSGWLPLQAVERITSPVSTP